MELELIINNQDIPKLAFGLAPLAIMGISAGINLLGGLISGGKAKKQAKAASLEKNRLNAKITALEKNRQPIVNPYASITDISGLAQDLSGLMSNPFENLGVATQAAQIQIEEADIALANTLDTIRATGSGAGGATALAQAALQSKKGVAASIEQQEAQNEKLKAQGESQLQQMKISEQQRLQGVQMGEAQRVQQADAAGQQFMFGAQEQRDMATLDRLSGQQSQARADIAQANQAGAAAFSGAMSGIGNIAGAYLGSAAAAPSPRAPLSKVSTISGGGPVTQRSNTSITAPIFTGF